jgi:hypothetical protein
LGNPSSNHSSKNKKNLKSRTAKESRVTRLDEFTTFWAVIYLLWAVFQKLQKQPNVLEFISRGNIHEYISEKMGRVSVSQTHLVTLKTSSQSNSLSVRL